MKTNNKVVISGLALGVIALAGAAVYGINQASADENNRNTIIQKIVERFGLNQEEVEQVFEEHKQEKQAERQAEKEEALSQAVTDGKITEEQKQLILQKMEENKGFKSSLKDLSQDEKRQKVQEHREEMKAWAEENGIDMKEIMPNKGGKKGMRGMNRGNGNQQ